MKPSGYKLISTYGSISSNDSMTNLTLSSKFEPYPYHKMVVDNEVLYEKHHPPTKPLYPSSKWIYRVRYRLLFSYIVYLVYLMIGASVFSVFESPMEERIIVEVIKKKQEFLTKYPMVTEKDLEALLDVVIRASNNGVTVPANHTVKSNWGFGGAILFASTVVTTVGYGDVTPLSKAGKIFCIFYGVFGIPLTMLMISALVEHLLKPTTDLLKALNLILGHILRPFAIRIIHLAMVVIFVVTFFFIIPASLFADQEPEWDFLDSVYFCYVSLTTIGLGDYIPGDSVEQEHRPMYKIATALYIFMGLIFYRLVEAVFHDIPQLDFSSIFTRVKPDNQDPEFLRLIRSGAMIKSNSQYISHKPNTSIS